MKGLSCLIPKTEDQFQKSALSPLSHLLFFLLKHGGLHTVASNKGLQNQPIAWIIIESIRKNHQILLGGYGRYFCAAYEDGRHKRLPDLLKQGLRKIIHGN
ncbi:hypothetical protein AKJ16_DCAP08911 [Drosera capensis]